MHFKIRLRQLYFILLYLTAFSIPFPFIFSTISIILTALVWLTVIDSKSLLQLKNRNGIWPSILFYLLCAISYCYSSDKAQTDLELQTKLSFLALPFIIGLGPKIDDKKLERLLFFYITGLGLIATFCLSRGLIVYIKTGNINQLFYHKLVLNLESNAVYYALYSISGLIAISLFPWKHTLFKNKYVVFTVHGILLVFFILLSSKTLLLLYLLFITIYHIYTRLKRKQTLIPAVGGMAVIFTIAGIIFFSDNPIRTRYDDIFKGDEYKSWNSDPFTPGYHFTNLTLRLFIWQNALGNIEEKNLWLKGCSVGDVKMLQKERMLRVYGNNINFNQEVKLWDFNLHNTYLQVLMMLGLPGLITFLWMVAAPFFIVKHFHHKLVLLFFNCTIVIFMLQESITQTQAGVVFYVFFLMVFWNFYYSSKDPSPKPELTILVK